MQALVQELSFEQQKRLTVGVELAANPSLLFLDEPTSGMKCMHGHICSCFVCYVSKYMPVRYVYVFVHQFVSVYAYAYVCGYLYLCMSSTDTHRMIVM